MTVWICSACGIEHSNMARPPARCAICSDERHYVPPGGQQWTSLKEMAGRFTGSFTELEPDLFAVRVSPSFGIGQRGLLVRTPAGNVLWEPPGYLDQQMIDEATALGGVAAVTASHPHLVGSSITWSKAFDGVPVYVNRADHRWIRRPDDVIRLWDDRQEIVDGVELIRCGGHFPGSAVLNWPAGAAAAGVLLVGDTLMVAADRASVSFMRSYPNLIPLPERLVTQIASTIGLLTFDRIYGAFHGSMIAMGSAEAVRASAARYIGWIRDEIRDPDEPGNARDH
ncbi:glyoxylase-like metal-dependent hydrolase (beta-lactamase superfamily II) [Nakamurella sp. UYEF19]|uniref:hydrolase n=1 Tax=Nakamurella sp. UYEF19 TaxID=1756392 RepID=UPI0033936D52